jgi:O-acetyl-ADP-ribose deacetylase (regulator of RNase III)
MLKEVAGDILLTKADMVAHGVAPNDGYANGLALSLRQQ